jgi:sulfite exporter TauE/SafE
MDREGGQFTVRGLFALVAACALLAALLRYSTMSATALLLGFSLGTIAALLFVAMVSAFDSIERSAQSRDARARQKELEAMLAAGSKTTPPTA